MEPTPPSSEPIWRASNRVHYNKPFADVFMEVAEPHRRQGVGCLLVQEISRECYLAGRVPATRCNVQNLASTATPTKAGMRTCGFLLTGKALKHPPA